MAWWCGVDFLATYLPLSAILIGGQKGVPFAVASKHWRCPVFFSFKSIRMKFIGGPNFKRFFSVKMSAQKKVIKVCAKQVYTLLHVWFLYSQLPNHPLTNIRNLVHLQVDIWSDLTCPWCYIGKKKFDAAVTQFTKAKVEVQWHAFLLDSSYHIRHPDGQPIEEALADKFGVERGKMIMERVIEAGRPAGATFANWRVRPNTMPGHRLVTLARSHGKDHEAEEALFVANYEQGRNISDADTLLEIAESLGLGLPKAELEEFVRCDDGVMEVLQDDEVAKRKLRITGVPAFFLGAGEKRVHISGGQPTEVFLEALEGVLQMQQGEA
jgi:predicted DsbA family dithiol-disulfide isomerase